MKLGLKLVNNTSKPGLNLTYQYIKTMFDTYQLTSSHWNFVWHLVFKFLTHWIYKNFFLIILLLLQIWLLIHEARVFPEHPSSSVNAWKGETTFSDFSSTKNKWLRLKIQILIQKPHWLYHWRSFNIITKDTCNNYSNI